MLFYKCIIFNYVLFAMILHGDKYDVIYLKAGSVLG